jgi:hypothetical protein
LHPDQGQQQPERQLELEAPAWSSNRLHEISWGTSQCHQPGGCAAPCPSASVRANSPSYEHLSPRTEAPTASGRHELVRQQRHRDMVRHLRLLPQLPLQRVRSHFLQLLPRRLELLGQLLLCRVVLDLGLTKPLPAVVTSRACARLCSSSKSSFGAWGCSRCGSHSLCSFSSTTK